MPIGDTTPGALVAAVREATERFKNIAAAEAEGYGLQFGCVSGPDPGAMGLRYVNFPLVLDGELDPAKGSAATLADIVAFYDTRFVLDLSEREKADRLAFLRSLSAAHRDSGCSASTASMRRAGSAAQSAAVRPAANSTADTSDSGPAAAGST